MQDSINMIFFSLPLLVIRYTAPRYSVRKGRAITAPLSYLYHNDKKIDLTVTPLIVVWKLDRFGRSLKQLITALDELSNLGVGFISYQDNLDLTTPQGRLMFHIIGAMAEFERELIRERVRAGLENARRKGKRLGRKPTAPIDVERAIQLHTLDHLLSIRVIAKKTRLSKSLVGEVLKEQASMVSS